MKNNIFILLLVFVGGLLITSCSDDQLEQVNPNELTTDSFWKTQEQCEQGINAIYNAFKNKDIMSLRMETQHADLAHKVQSDHTSNPFYLKNYNNSNSFIQDKWSALYTGIFRANQALEGLAKFKAENPDFDEEQWNDWYAQARFFRGLFHFYLYSSFNNGEVPIRDAVPASTEDYNVPVSSAQDVFNFFISDLRAAYVDGMLPTSWVKGKEGKITRGAVAAVLGQAYLYEANYDSAKFFFEDVINNYGYALTVNAEDNVTTLNEFNTESILEIAYSENLKPEEDVNAVEGVSNKYVDDVSPIEAQYGGSMFPSFWLQMAYKKDSMDTTDPRNLGDEIDIITGEPTGNTILRKYNRRASAYIAFVDDYFTPYYLSRPVFAYNYPNGNTAMFKMLSNCDKYDYDDKNRPNSETYKSGVNYRVIRLADVYLWYAEALVAGGTNDGGVDKALEYINEIRYRSALLLCGMPSGPHAGSDFDDKMYSAQDVMDQLMYVECPLEISILGHANRHIDLRRWGIYEERFEELAAQRYAFGSYPVEKWSEEVIDGETKRKYLYPGAAERPIDPRTGKPVIRWGCIVYDESYFDNAVGWNGAPPKSTSWRTEFGESAANYIESEHAYWPIPLVEETTNPNIYGN